MLLYKLEIIFDDALFVWLLVINSSRNCKKTYQIYQIWSLNFYKTVFFFTFQRKIQHMHEPTA